MINKTQLINEAIGGITPGDTGQSYDPIDPERSETRQGELAWEFALRKLRGAANWTFLSRKLLLTGGMEFDQETENFNHRYKFELPADYARAIGVFERSIGLEFEIAFLIRPDWYRDYSSEISAYEIQGEFLYTNYAEVYFFYQKKIITQIVPEYFETALVDLMCQYLAIPMGNSLPLHRTKKMEAMESVYKAQSQEFLSFKKTVFSPSGRVQRF